jgi:hypothetical protein
MEPLLNYTIVQKANWPKIVAKKLGRSLMANNGIPILVISMAHSSMEGQPTWGPPRLFEWPDKDFFQNIYNK